MKKNLKVGDKVIINLSAKYDGPCNITDSMRGYDKREAEIVSITNSHDGSNRYKLDVDGECYCYVDEWLNPVKKPKKKKGQISLVIPINEWKKIYDIACDEWKKKLYAMVEPFADSVTIDEQFADSMIKASTGSQIRIVRRVLSIAGYSPNNCEDYFDFGCEWNIGTSVINTPMHIRYGFASSEDMESREIGFSTDSYDVIVVQDGFEINLTKGSYMKFKKK